MPDDSILVNDKSGTAADESLLVEDAVGFDDLSLDVAEQGKSHPDVFLEAVVSGVAVNADADDLRITFFEIGDISLIRLQLLRSTPGEGEHVEGERDVLLAAEIRELDGLPVRIIESEIGRGVSLPQMRLWGARLLRGGITTIRTGDALRLAL